jgi:hypothetical protein
LIEEDDEIGKGNLNSALILDKDTLKKKMKGLDIRRLQMNQDKIFAFKDFGDFKQKYFNKGLVVMDDINRGKLIKETRMKYAKRF